MKGVIRDVQDLYERKVLEEFRGALSKGLSIDNSYVDDYEESYKNYLAWLTPRELLQEYKFMRFPWRYRERKWIKEEIESRCI